MVFRLKKSLKPIHWDQGRSMPFALHFWGSPGPCWLHGSAGTLRSLSECSALDRCCGHNLPMKHRLYIPSGNLLHNYGKIHHL
jgi:hypothetical protein